MLKRSATELGPREGFREPGIELDQMRYEDFAKVVLTRPHERERGGSGRIENACGGITGRSPRIWAFVMVLWESQGACVESAPAAPGACGAIFGSEVKTVALGYFVGFSYHYLFIIVQTDASQSDVAASWHDF